MHRKVRGNRGKQTLVVHTDQILGSGAFGVIMRAKLGKIPCAAKTTQTQCSLRDKWQSLKHPNVVQFLGALKLDNCYMLLVELMSESLTRLSDTYPTMSKSTSPLT